MNNAVAAAGARGLGGNLHGGGGCLWGTSSRAPQPHQWFVLVLRCRELQVLLHLT
jgi:hypothetical protein